MLDLDFLAEQCAQRDGQNDQAWKTALWSPAFQAITAAMSDGEVETLLSWCPSVSHLEALIQFIQLQAQAYNNGSPFTFLVGEAERAGMTPDQWVRTALGKETIA